MPRNPTPKGVDSLILCGLGVPIIVVYILTGIFDTCFSASAGFLFEQNVSTKREQH